MSNVTKSWNLPFKILLNAKGKRAWRKSRHNRTSLGRESSWTLTSPGREMWKKELKKKSLHTMHVKKCFLRTGNYKAYYTGDHCTLI